MQFCYLANVMFKMQFILNWLCVCFQRTDESIEAKREEQPLGSVFDKHVVTPGYFSLNFFHDPLKNSGKLEENWSYFKTFMTIAFPINLHFMMLYCISKHIFLSQITQHQFKTFLRTLCIHLGSSPWMTTKFWLLWCTCRFSLTMHLLCL